MFNQCLSLLVLHIPNPILQSSTICMCDTYMHRYLIVGTYELIAGIDVEASASFE